MGTDILKLVTAHFNLYLSFIQFFIGLYWLKVSHYIVNIVWKYQIYPMFCARVDMLTQNTTSLRWKSAHIVRNKIIYKRKIQEIFVFNGEIHVCFQYRYNLFSVIPSWIYSYMWLEK